MWWWIVIRIRYFIITSYRPTYNKKFSLNVTSLWKVHIASCLALHQIINYWHDMHTLLSATNIRSYMILKIVFSFWKFKVNYTIQYNCIATVECDLQLWPPFPPPESDLQLLFMKTFANSLRILIFICKITNYQWEHVCICSTYFYKNFAI